MQSHRLFPEGRTESGKPDRNYWMGEHFTAQILDNQQLFDVPFYIGGSSGNRGTDGTMGMQQMFYWK